MRTHKDATHTAHATYAQNTTHAIYVECAIYTAHTGHATLAIYTPHAIFVTYSTYTINAAHATHMLTQTHKKTCGKKRRSVAFKHTDIHRRPQSHHLWTGTQKPSTYTYMLAM